MKTPSDSPTTDAELTQHDEAIKTTEGEGARPILGEAAVAAINKDVVDQFNAKDPAADATVSDAIDDARPDAEGTAEATDTVEEPEAGAAREYVGFPQYQCHKTVEAFKIANMESMSNGDIRLIGAGGVHSVVVGPAYVDKHRPQEGGYFVKYHDGYRSWSPADAFEQGYTLFGG